MVNKIMKKTHWVSLGVLFLIILIGTYVMWTTYNELTSEEKEQVEEISYGFGYPNLLGLSILVAVACVFICMILVDPFKILESDK